MISFVLFFFQMSLIVQICLRFSKKMPVSVRTSVEQIGTPWSVPLVNVLQCLVWIMGLKPTHQVVPKVKRFVSIHECVAITKQETVWCLFQKRSWHTCTVNVLTKFSVAGFSQNPWNYQVIAELEIWPTMSGLSIVVYMVSLTNEVVEGVSNM